MKKIVLAYAVVLVVIMSSWYLMIPTQDELTKRQAKTKLATVVRSLESQVTSRFGQVDIKGNLTHKIYTYNEVNVTNWEIGNSMTTITLFFTINKTVRVKKHGLVVDQHPGGTEDKSIQADLIDDSWVLDPKSTKDLS